MEELSVKDAEVGQRVAALEEAEAALHEQLAALEEGVAALEADKAAVAAQQRQVEEARALSQKDAEVGGLKSTYVLVGWGGKGTSLIAGSRALHQIGMACSLSCVGA
jgi:hypothetical protein